MLQRNSIIFKLLARLGDLIKTSIVAIVVCMKRLERRWRLVAIISIANRVQIVDYNDCFQCGRVHCRYK
jgi:hypothetical protein